MISLFDCISSFDESLTGVKKTYTVLSESAHKAAGKNCIYFALWLFFFLLIINLSVWISGLFISRRQVNFSDHRQNTQQTFKPLPPCPFQTPHLPTPTLLFGANAQAYGEMCYMRSALSQGKRSCRRSALCCLCLLSHFLLFFITFNTYSCYEPGEATQWRYADVWAFRSGTYWNLKHGRRTPAGSTDCVWDDGHGAMRSPGSGPAEPMLLRWWRWWCFRSCWCQNAPLLSSVFVFSRVQVAVCDAKRWR